MGSIRSWFIWQFSVFVKIIIKKKNFKSNWRSIVINSLIEDNCDIGRSILINSSIDKYSYVNSGTVHFAKIGKFCSIGQNVNIGLFAKHPMNISTHPSFFHKKPQINKSFFIDENHIDYFHISIGHDVWIGNNVSIMDGLDIGTGAIIGTGSIVTKDVEPYSVVAGSPAKEIRKRFSDVEVSKLIKSEWWNFPEEKIKKVANLIGSCDVKSFLEKLEKN